MRTSVLCVDLIREKITEWEDKKNHTNLSSVAKRRPAVCGNSGVTGATVISRGSHRLPLAPLGHDELPYELYV